MSKSLKTKLFFLVTMIVCLVCALGISASAQENTASTGTPLETRYGTFYIPEGEEGYAWVSFKEDGTFITASNMLVADSGNVLQHEKHSDSKDELSDRKRSHEPLSFRLCGKRGQALDRSCSG
jgi:hypothetical protein